MQNLRNSVTVALFAVLIGAGAMFSGCTSYATPEQLARIAELEREINSLQTSIQTKQSQLSTIDRQVSAQEAKLDQCAKDKDLVKQRLANWQGN